MNTVQTPQPNTQYFNPQDGRTYNVKQEDPSGKGTIMVDAQTQEEQLLPNPSMQEVQMNNGAQSLKPIMKTQTLGATMANDIDTIVNGDADEGRLSQTSPEEVLPEVQDFLKQDIDHAIQEVDRHAQGIDGDIQEIVDNAEMFNAVAPAVGDESATVIDSVQLPDGQIRTKDIPLDEDAAREPSFASHVAPPKVQTTPKRWEAIRAGLKTQGELDFNARQLVHLRNAGLAHRAAELGFAPDKREADDSGHSAQGIPISGPPKEKNEPIGLTEFPKGEKRDDSVGLDTSKGYNIPMKEMDEAQVANREKFDNEQRQYLSMMTIRQLRELFNKDNKAIDAVERGKGLQQIREPGKVEDNPLYDGIEQKAIARAVGLQAVAIELATPSQEDIDAPAPKQAPVTHKPLKKAPGVEGYEEPGVIQPAPKEIRVHLDNFEQHYQRLQELKDQLAKAMKPHQDALMSEQVKGLPGIQAQTKLMTEALDMLYQAIASTQDGLVHYHEELWAAVSREKRVTPAVTVPQVVAAAKLVDQRLAEKIEELAKAVQDQGSSLIEERTLYEFPPSKEHLKRMQPEAGLHAVASISLDTIGELIRGFLFVASEIAEARQLLAQ